MVPEVLLQFGQRPRRETQSQIWRTGGRCLNHQRFWLLPIELRSPWSWKVRKPGDARLLKSLDPFVRIGVMQSGYFAGFSHVEPGRQLPNKIAPAVKASRGLLGPQQSLKLQQLLCRKRG